MFKLLRQSPISARLGIGIVLLNCLVAIFAPLIAPYGETSVVGDVWEQISKQFYLGTDHIGRDLFTRMVYGGRNPAPLPSSFVMPAHPRPCQQNQPELVSFC